MCKFSTHNWNYHLFSLCRVLACRNEEKTDSVIDEIKAETGNNNVEFLHLDLSSLSSVKKFSDQFMQHHDRLDVLMNNAAALVPFSLTEDGIESQFAAHHVAHHYLTMLLLPLLQKSAPSRIVNVSSHAHLFAPKELDLENINDPTNYKRFIQYGKTKACNILFTQELAKRLESKQVYVNSNHPGDVKTDIYRHSNPFFAFVLPLFCMNVQDGALTQLYLATSPEIEENNINGQYYAPFGVPYKPGGAASSKEEGSKLWEFTESLLKEKIPSYQGASV